MDRRSFLKGMGGILAAATAPAIVRADSLMQIVPSALSIIVPSQSLELPKITAASIGALYANDIRTDTLRALYDLESPSRPVLHTASLSTLIAAIQARSQADEQFDRRISELAPWRAPR